MNAQLLSKSTVTVVKKRQSHHLRNKSRNTNHVRVTRIKSITSNSTTNMQRNATSTPQQFNICSKDERSLTSMSFTHLIQSQSSNVIIKKQLNNDLNLQYTPVSSIIGENHNIKLIQPSVSSMSSSTIKPLNDYNSTDIMVTPFGSAKKKSIYDFDNIRHIKTIGEEHGKNKRHHKLCQNHTFFRNSLILALVVTLIIAIAIVVPLTLTVLKTTTAAITMQTIGFLYTTETSTTTSSSTITSSSSSSTTTASTTTESTTSLAATVTITSNPCTANWTGIQMVDNCVNCFTLLSYYHYIRNYTAIGTQTRIVFALRRQTGYYALDDISVKSFTAPSVEILTNGGFETSDLTGWSYCNQNNAANTGGVKANASFTYLGVTYYSDSGSYFYVGGSNISTDYLGQTFTTIIGVQYTVKFSFVHAGSGTSTSVDLFLGL